MSNDIQPKPYKKITEKQISVISAVIIYLVEALNTYAIAAKEYNTQK